MALVKLPILLSERFVRLEYGQAWLICTKSQGCARPAPAGHQLWQRRYVPFNVFSEKKHMEKLDYMHYNPVKKRLVRSRDQWPWSSFRFYDLNDSSVLSMDSLG